MSSVNCVILGERSVVALSVAGFQIMPFQFSRSTRLYVVIAISTCFFLGEISGEESPISKKWGGADLD